MAPTPRPRPPRFLITITSSASKSVWRCPRCCRSLGWVNLPPIIWMRCPALTQLLMLPGNICAELDLVGCQVSCAVCLSACCAGTPAAFVAATPGSDIACAAARSKQQRVSACREPARRCSSTASTRASTSTVGPAPRCQTRR
eukprot:3187069-Rhodomonas_salina.3